jgi:hypothetical protein
MTIYKVIHVVVDPKTGRKMPGPGVTEYHLTKSGALKACRELAEAIVETIEDANLRVESDLGTGFEVTRMALGYSVRVWNKGETTMNEITARAVKLTL